MDLHSLVCSESWSSPVNHCIQMDAGAVEHSLKEAGSNGNGLIDVKTHLLWQKN